MFEARLHDASALKGAAPAGELVLTVLGASPDCVKLVETDGRLSFMNACGMELMELPSFGMVEGKLWSSLWPEEARPMLDDAVSRARKGETVRFTAFCPTAAGTPKWWDVTVAPVQGGAGEVVRLLSVSRDVSERVAREKVLEAALAQKDLLMREVDHRVKNSLAIVSSLLRGQSRASASPEVKAALTQAAARVATVARVHDRLHRAAQVNVLGLDDYLAQLARDLMPGAARLTLVVAPLQAGPELAAPLGLVVAEALTNAEKHAGPEAHVWLTLAHEGAHATLTIEDDGPGLPDDFSVGAARGKGLGMQVVAAMAEQLEGTIRTGESRVGGALLELRFPVPPVQE